MNIGIGLRGDFLENKSLPKRTLILWQIRALLLGVFCVGLCLYFASALEILYQISFVLSIITLIVTVVYLPLFFKSYKIELKNEAVVISYGIILKVTHIMPYSRLIYAQSFASPLARIFGLSILTLKAARSWIVIPEIEKSGAENIINHLSSEERNG